MSARILLWLHLKTFLLSMTSSTVETRTTACLNCSSSDFTLFAEEEGVKVVRCKSCGLVFNNPQIFKRAIAEIYTEDYYKSSFPALGYEDYAANKNDIQHSFRRRLPHLKKYTHGKSLLDVGCACGFFLEVAAENGYQPEGIDCSEWATHYARKNLNFPVHTGLVDTYPWPAGTKYDVITCWDVIEQLPDPKSFFSKIYDLLADDGILALTVRDINSLMARAMKTKWIHFRPREKYVYFSKLTVKDFLTRLGFQVEEMTFQNAGKDCTFEILAKKMSHSSRFAGNLASSVFKGLGLWNKTLYLNFMDSILVIARKGRK